MGKEIESKLRGQDLLNILESILLEGAIRATKYVEPNFIIRGVRKTYKAYGRKPRKDQNAEITLTIGRPNYMEREFIKVCKKAGEPFPVKKIQMKFPIETKIKKK